MPSFVQMLVAVAITGLLIGFEHPALLVAGAVAGVWPDFLAWVLTPLRASPDLLITPDPDHPEAVTVTTGLYQAAQAARTHARAWRIRLNPVPTHANTFINYELDLDRFQKASVRLESQAANLDWHGWLPLHPLPLKVSNEMRDLILTPLADGRIASEVVPRMHPAGHTWLWLPVLPTIALASPKIALVAGVVMALHLALDYCGHATMAPLWPFSAHTTGGLCIWHGRPPAAAGWLAGMAALVLIMAVLASAQISGMAAYPTRTWLLGATLTGLTVVGVRRFLRK